MQAASLGRDGALRPAVAGKDPEALTDNHLKRSALHRTTLPRAPLCPAPLLLSASLQVQHGGGGDEAHRGGGGGLPRHDLPALPGAWGQQGLGLVWASAKAAAGGRASR